MREEFSSKAGAVTLIGDALTFAKGEELAPPGEEPMRSEESPMANLCAKLPVKSGAESALLCVRP